MKAYRVEKMDGDVVQESQNTEASTPFSAAEKVLGRKVTLRGDASKWIRVVDLTEKAPARRRPSVYEYRALVRSICGFVTLIVGNSLLT